MTRHLILCGDVREILASCGENEFDACFCDPPYGLEFMGKEWDKLDWRIGAGFSDGGSERFKNSPPLPSFAHATSENRICHICGGTERGRDRQGFHRCRCEKPDFPERTYRPSDSGQAMQGWHYQWAREVFRVLKPGAPLLAFGGTRTHHRLMCAIEDAGFEIRDCLMWLYGSGFPKSLDVSKAIDKAERGFPQGGPDPTSPNAGNYKGGCSEDNPIGRGFGAGPGKFMKEPGVKQQRDLVLEAQAWIGYGTALKPAWEPIILAMKPCEGTFAENALRWGVAGLAIDACRIGVGGQWKWRTPRGHGWDGYVDAGDGTPYGPNRQGRWPANLLLDEEAAGMLDEQSGQTLSRGGSRGKGGVWGQLPADPDFRPGFGDTGGASRFFYCAKASRSERGEGNSHPTVKPLKLCEYLARLILPPARETPRAFLAPFSGSGSEMIGALRAGWDHVTGIEISENYCRIAEARLAEALRA